MNNRKTNLSKEEIKWIEGYFSRLAEISEIAEDKICDEREGGILTFGKHEPDVKKIISLTEDTMKEISEIFNALQNTCYESE